MVMDKPNPKQGEKVQMLNLHLYMSFCVLIVILAFTPGPNVLLVVKSGLEHKLSRAIFPIPGIALAIFTYAVIVAVGLSRILTKYPLSYEIIRLSGACYLIYMGGMGFYKLYKNKAKLQTCNSEMVERCRRKMFVSGYMCSITNPKTFVMYLVLLPQFVDPAYKALPQFFLLGLTHIFIVIIAMLTYCFLANKSQSYIKKYARAQASFTNLTLVILGVFLLVEKSIIH